MCILLLLLLLLSVILRYYLLSLFLIRSYMWVSEWVSQFIHSALKAERVTSALQPRRTKMSLKVVWTARVFRLIKQCCLLKRDILKYSSKLCVVIACLHRRNWSEFGVNVHEGKRYRSSRKWTSWTWRTGSQKIPGKCGRFFWMTPKLNCDSAGLRGR